MALSETTETFEVDEAALLAALVYKRFGWKSDVAAAAWRRLHDSHVGDVEFLGLASLALAHVRFDRHRLSLRRV